MHRHIGGLPSLRRQKGSVQQRTPVEGRRPQLLRDYQAERDACSCGPRLVSMQLRTFRSGYDKRTAGSDSVLEHLRKPCAVQSPSVHRTG